MLYLSALKKALEQVPQLEVYLGVRDKDCGTLPIRAGHDDPIVISVGEINWEGSFRLEFHPHSGELLRVVRELWGISGEIVSQVVDPRTYMPKTEE